MLTEVDVHNWKAFLYYSSSGAFNCGAVKSLIFQ